ncbi:MAG: hypothetical protein COX65_09805 [Elusimicrobia bacterium CG_4_10_14_0_2_um_filter_56_8]|nr:MAG: hypothetical protein COX65_09805 [Elusimicrobia bacterium CG_4_10_14_0_2_um_filter_56_8]
MRHWHSLVPGSSGSVVKIFQEQILGGEPVKIVDLARNMIVLNGLVPERDIEIKFTGLKAGDKMYEELFRAGDIRKDTGHSEIFAAVPAEADAGLSDACRAELQQLAAGADKAAILGKIKALVPAYTGWPRGAAQREGKGNEAKPRGNEARPREAEGEAL